MKLLHKKRYGRDRFIAISDQTKEFLNVFRHHDGRDRQSLTLEQVQSLKKLGITLEIEEFYDCPAI